MNEWTLRKCSAAALDVLASVYQTDILPSLLPQLKELLMSQDWKQKECGVLALGAISEGCIVGVEAHLKDLVTFLTNNCLSDAKVIIKIFFGTIFYLIFYLIGKLASGSIYYMLDSWALC